MSECILRSLRVICFLFIFVGAVQAGEGQESKVAQDLAFFKEVSQLKIGSLKEIVQRDVAAINAKFESLEKRIDAQNAKIDQGLSLLGTLLSGLGIVLTVFGVFSFISLQSRAKQEARQAALEWFKANAESLKGEIFSLQERLAGLEQQATESIAKHVQWVEAGALDARQQIQKSIGAPTEGPPDVAAQSALALAEAVQTTKSKPEKDYDFSDFANLAFDYFNKGNKARAAEFWEKAAKHPNASDEEAAISLFNLAVTYRDLNLVYKSLATFDSVIEKFLDNSSAGARMYAGKAIISKAYALSDQEDNEQATQAYFKFFEWAVRYSYDGLAEYISQARNGFGFMLLCEAKKELVEYCYSHK